MGTKWKKYKLPQKRCWRVKKETKKSSQREKKREEK